MLLIRIGMVLRQDKLKELFEVKNNELYWKDGIQKNTKGKLAGWVDKKGYRSVMLEGKTYQVHRLIWIIMFGSIPYGVIDHIDRNPKNNCIENLRPASRSENAFNRPASINNKLGVKNVYKRGSRYAVQLRVNYKLINFGSYEDLELATLVAEEARNKYHGEFARHA